MTKAIEDALDLPRMKEVLDALNAQDDTPLIEENKITVDDQTMDEMKLALANSKNLVDRLAQIQAFADHSKRMRAFSETATRNSNDLFELAMNVDPKHSGPIFEASKDFMKNAIDAENSIVEKILRTEKLELDKKRLEAKIRSEGGDDLTIDAENTVMIGDTSDIIRKLLDNKKEEDSK